MLPLRILVVEDDASVRGLIDRVLTAAGHQVLAAPSPGEASAFVLYDMPQVPELALLDIVLPGASGLQYAGDLRRLFPAIRLLFMTGWLEDEQDLQQQARRLGRILYKPFDRRALLDAVSDAATTPSS